jgi:hypothetical protein
MPTHIVYTDGRSGKKGRVSQCALARSAIKKAFVAIENDMIVGFRKSRSSTSSALRYNHEASLVKYVDKNGVVTIPSRSEFNTFKEYAAFQKYVALRSRRIAPKQYQLKAYLEKVAHDESN